MPAQSVPIKPGGSIPEIDIHVGQAHDGHYAVFRWEPSATVVQSGRTDAHFPLAASTGVLVGKTVSWNITVQSRTKNPNETYSATVTITQDGTPIYTKTYPEVPGTKLNVAEFLTDGVTFTSQP